jgi:hypothetical protein
MLGSAIRIAQRMGIHNESTTSKSTILEAEMRRRVWWSLTLFDNRVSELAGYPGTSLTPTWNCKIPLGVSDSDLGPEMTEAPKVGSRTADTIFAVVRSEMGEFLRHTKAHLDFSNPALKPLVLNSLPGDLGDSDKLAALEKRVEEEYLKFCNPENPLHYMTTWVARTTIAKYRLVELYARNFNSTMAQIDAQRETAMTYALRTLEGDSKIMSSPITKGYRWLLHFHFPFPAYIHITHELKRNPMHLRADEAWEYLSNNYEHRFDMPYPDHRPVYKLLSKFVFQAWTARETAFKKASRTTEMPRIVANIKRRLGEARQLKPNPSSGKPTPDPDIVLDDFLQSMPIPLSMDTFLKDDCSGATSGFSQPISMQMQTSSDVTVDQLNLGAGNWNLGPYFNWERN